MHPTRRDGRIKLPHQAFLEKRENETPAANTAVWMEWQFYPSQAEGGRKMSDRPTPETDAERHDPTEIIIKCLRILARDIHSDDGVANLALLEAADCLERVTRERDEAREILREMWQSGDAFLPYIDQETINRWRRAAGNWFPVEA